MTATPHSGKIIYRVLAAIAAFTLFYSGGCSAQEQTTMIDVTLDRPSTSSAEVTVEDDRAVIDVTDQAGINGLSARLVEGEWPAEIIVRLRLRGLERLEINYGNYTITTGVSSTGAPPPPLTLTVVNEDGSVSSAPPSADVYYPDIRAVTPDGTAAVGPLATGERPAFPLPEGSAFEITLPPHFHQVDTTSFQLQWIDFYR
jgi:hypothetical protein